MFFPDESAKMLYKLFNGFLYKKAIRNSDSFFRWALLDGGVFISNRHPGLCTNLLRPGVFATCRLRTKVGRIADFVPR